MRRLKRTPLVSLAVGVAVGLIVTAVGVGVGATHLACVGGAVVGWSGPIGSPLEIALAPPGGYVNDSYTMRTNLTSTSWSDTSESSSVPTNWSSVDLYEMNWTYRAADAQVEPGWGSSPPCSGFLSVNGGPSIGCGQCVLANATPGGVGQRLSVPEPIFFGGPFGVPLAGVNLTYPAAPIASIEWAAGPGPDVQWNQPQALVNLGVVVGPFEEHGSLYGLGITVVQRQMSFEVPIHFLNGTERSFPALFPSDWPAGPPGGTSLWISDTYVLPLATGQGTWAVYLAGGTDQLAAGGLLFEQTAS